MTEQEQRAVQIILSCQEYSIVSGLLDAINVLVVMLDRQGRIVHFNRTCEQISGYRFEQVKGRHFWDLFVPAPDRETVKTVFEQFCLGRSPNEYENYWLMRDGSRRLIAWSGTALVGADGSVECIVATGLDKTGHQQAKEALHQSETFNRAILSSLTAHIAVLDNNGVIITTNEAWDRFARENGEEHLSGTGIGVNYLEVCRRAQGKFAAEAQAALTGLQAVLDGVQNHFVLEYPCHSPAEKRWFLMHATPLSNKPGGVVVAHINITGRKKIEDEKVRLFEAVSQQQVQLRALARRLTEAQEAERKRLALELHDQVGQNLTALGLNLNIIRAELPGGMSATSAIQARLEDSLALVEQTTERIRDVMADLRPPVLDDYGLVAGLDWYGQRFARRLGLTVTVHGHEPTPRLPAPLENALFRIAQEALTNAAKHAQASEVRLTVEMEGEIIRLIVADNGTGFEVTHLDEPAERQSWGLMGMAEQAEAVGGHCRIESGPGQGTRVIVEAPWSTKGKSFKRSKP
jgi:PAS domain S-box-containing protein